MIVLIVAAFAVFGFGIIQKATYKVAEGDSVSISYSIIDGDNTYDNQATSVIIGSNEDAIFTDEVLTGLSYGSHFSFDTTLTEDKTLSDSEATTLTKGTEVKIDAELSEVIPAAPETEESSETVSE